jgi:glycosyltransferase involved in cell wall biosynthesis
MAGSFFGLRSSGVRLSVVIPICNEREVLPTLIERLDAAFAGLDGVEPTVLFVDDGSHDGSTECLREQARRDGRFRVLELSRNFGHQPAITAGLDAADGDAVIVMDGDLQDPPELIPELVERWKRGAEVVRAVRRSRGDRGLRGLGFKLFHLTMGYLTDMSMAGNAGVFGLMDRQAVDALRALPERNRFLPGLSEWIGFRQDAVPFDRPARAEGESRQSLWRLVRYAFDAFFSFSYKPLRLMTAGGLIVSGCGFALGLGFVFRRLLGYEIADTGFTTLVTLILFLGGLQLISLGVLGEYIARIYDEAKNRPLYVARRPDRSAARLPREQPEAAAGPDHGDDR